MGSVWRKLFIRVIREFRSIYNCEMWKNWSLSVCLFNHIGILERVAFLIERFPIAYYYYFVKGGTLPVFVPAACSVVLMNRHCSTHLIHISNIFPFFGIT
jgi:hypothetical protein